MSIPTITKDGQKSPPVLSIPFGAAVYTLLQRPLTTVNPSPSLVFQGNGGNFFENFS
nr:MAG TPA: hypothetical protein [Caudoviricetes sp.]